MKTMFIPRSDYLEHHGILGQKWGVRRYQNKDGSLTAAGKKRALERGEDYSLKAGTELYRVTNNSNGYNDTTSRVYASGNKKDHAKWKKEYDQGYSYYQKLYDCRLKTVKDIKVAGETALGQAWLESMQSEGFRKMALSDMNMLANNYGLHSGAKNENDMTYDKFSRTLGYHTKSGDGFLTFMNQVKGYDAIIDYYGRHTKDSDVLKNISEPLIILNPQENLKKESIKKMRRMYGV